MNPRATLRFRRATAALAIAWAMLALAVGLAALGLVAFLYMGRQIPLGGQTIVITSIIVVGILLVAMVFVLRNR